MKEGRGALSLFPWIVFFLVLVVPAISIAACPASQDLADYTAYPPFAADAVAPNILIILDNSISMNKRAYPDDFTDEKQYYGYFNNQKTYIYDEIIQAFKLSDSGPWSGNFLNWLCMRRIDILRKVLVGGDTDGIHEGPVVVHGEDNEHSMGNYSEYVTADGLTPYEGNKRFSVSGDSLKVVLWGRDDEYKIAVLKEPSIEPDEFLWPQDDPENATKARLSGVLQRIGNRARWGNMWFNLNPLYETGQEGAKLETPISEISDEFIASIQGKSCDTCTPLAESLFCGLSYYRQEIPEGFDPDETVGPVEKTGATDPYYRDSEAVPCAPSYVLMLTDGSPTDDTNIPDGRFSDRNGNGYLDEIAAWGKTQDMREDLDEAQHVVFYAVYAFGNDADDASSASEARALLQSAAMKGGYGDQNGDGIPDTYFEADDGEELERQLQQAFFGMLDVAVSGTATTLMATTSKGEGVVLQASFKSIWSDNGKLLYWPGFLKCLTIDADGNIDEDNPVWEAGEQLKHRDAADRTLYTFIDKNGDGAATAGEFIEFGTDNVADLLPYLDIPSDGSWNFLGDSETGRAERLIDYIRGTDFPGARGRTTADGKVWKLGDIVHSTPVTVAYPASWYQVTYGDTEYHRFFTAHQDREFAVYVGANDGMLHAFSAGEYDVHTGAFVEHPDTPGVRLGGELWGFIPQALLPHLKWLALPNYTHVYYVDQKPLVVDARIQLTGEAEPKWRTLLIGGLRYGGKTICAGEREFSPSYFCIDITEPRDPRLLWERSYEGMGFSFSVPTVVKKNPTSGDSKWFLVFGSGPTTYTGASTQAGRIFAVDLATGELKKRFDTETPDAFFSSPSAIDKDLKSDFDHSIIYLGETHGQITDAGQDFRGNMFRLDLKGEGGDHLTGDDPDDWELEKIFQVERPITAGMSLCVDYADNVWLFFGTGKFLYLKTDEAVADDSQDKTDQYLIGLKDPFEEKSYQKGLEAAGYPVNSQLPLRLAHLHPSDGIKVAEDGQVVDTTDSAPSLASWSQLSADVNEYRGWYRTLQDGERCITRPFVFGGAVLVPTFVPEDTICEFGGTTYLYALYYKTGTAYYRTIFVEEETSTETHCGEELEVVTDKIDFGVGMPPAELGLFWGRDGFKVISQQSDTTPAVAGFDTPIKMRSGLTSWREE